jgi:hypothetical protein
LQICTVCEEMFQPPKEIAKAAELSPKDKRAWVECVCEECLVRCLEMEAWEKDAHIGPKWAD